MTRLCLVLLASCAAAQATQPPATSVINDQHTTGGTGPVTSAQAYVAPPAPEAPLLEPLPTAGTPTKQLVKAEVTECRHAPKVVAAVEPVCAVRTPHRRRHAR